MDHECLIEVSQLSRHFPGSRRMGKKTDKKNSSETLGKIIAVDNISFTLQRGEVLGFLGPNGAGKSTTLQMLTSNLAPTHGSIKIGGFDLMDNPIEAKAMIGYLPDTPPLYKELSVDEYLDYCARLNKVARSKVRQAINIAKERCGLTEHGKRIINNLSKGYQQRVGIAQAIIHTPDIVILDEPTTGLDPIQMIEIRKLIQELGEHHSVMLSSHILPEIQAICNNVQIINQGKLVFNAPIEQLNQRMQTHSLRMSCTKSIAIDKIEALDAISSVHYTQQGMGNHSSGNQISKNQSLTIQCSHQDTNNNPSAVIATAQQLIALAEQHHWGLYEIYVEKRTLEDIFMSLTCVDPISEMSSDNQQTRQESTAIESTHPEAGKERCVD